MMSYAEPPVVLVLGDSLSAAYGIDRELGWVRLLATRLNARQPPYRVVNASVSGETSAGGLNRLPGLLQRYRPAVLVVQLGANDGLRGLPLETLEANLGRLIALGQEAGARVLVVGTRLPPNYGTAYTQRFQEVFSAAAGRAGIPLAPRLLAGVAEDWDSMQADGLHPNAAAQPRLLDNVWPQLAPLLEAAPP